MARKTASQALPRKRTLESQCVTPEESRVKARGVKRLRQLTSRQLVRVTQNCGSNNPTAGTLTYGFDGVTYRSPNQHSSPSSFVANSKPTMPAFVPFRDGNVKVWQGWLYGDGGFHSSIDYGLDQKTFPVHAIASGKVVFAGWHEWHGNVVIIEHAAAGAQPFRSMYFHMRNGKTHDIAQARNTNPSNYSAGSDSRTKAERYKKYADLAYGGTSHWGTDTQKLKVKVGDNVSTGQQIGWAGNTGIGGASAMLGADGKPQSSGQTNIHLHFMIARKDGGNWYFVDPYGAYSQSTSCYTGTGSGAYAHYFGPVYPYYHDADASLFQEAFNYYAQMGYGPTDFSFPWKASDLRVSGIFSKSPEAFIVHHGMTESVYVSNWENYRKKGFRPHKQFVYSSSSGSPRFACIWRPAKGEAWASFHRLTPDEFNAKVNAMAQPGFRLTDFSVYRMGGNLRVAAIWVKDPKGHYVWWGLTSAGYNAKFDELVKQGYALTHFVAYDAGSSIRYGGIWTKGVFPSFFHWYGLTFSGYQAKFDEMAAKGCRLIEVVGYADSTRFAGLWVKGVTGEPQLF